MSEETFHSYLGADGANPKPLVISDGFSKEELESKPLPVPAEVVERETSLVEDVGAFIVDQLNRRQAPFKKKWLVHDGDQLGVRAGRLTFTLQGEHDDQYRAGELGVLEVTVRVRRSLWQRLWPWS